MTEKETPKKKKIGSLGWGLIIAGILVVGQLGLMGAGYLYQLRTTRENFERFPAPGMRVDVGGYSLHLNCQGEGSPTVVVDAGNGDFSLGWVLVQPEVAKFARICTYDRAGYAWSDPGAEPRDALQMATELHTLLANAGENGPYILVGHSLGGYTVRQFASLYPDLVAGMVLVDAGHEAQLDRFPQEYLQLTQQQERFSSVMGSLARYGVLRLLGKAVGEGTLPPHIQKLPPDVKDVYLTLMSHPSYFEATLGELDALEATCAEVAALGGLGDLPLVVLTAEHSVDPATLESIGMQGDTFPIEEIQTLWIEMQTELAGLSTNSAHQIVAGSGHAIHLDQPAVVVAAIRQVFEACQ
jgi:pimeloyl-ACP methyl ester carboxylesterase